MGSTKACRISQTMGVSGRAGVWVVRSCADAAGFRTWQQRGGVCKDITRSFAAENLCLLNLLHHEASPLFGKPRSPYPGAAVGPVPTLRSRTLQQCCRAAVVSQQSCLLPRLPGPCCCPRDAAWFPRLVWAASRSQPEGRGAQAGQVGSPA